MKHEASYSEEDLEVRMSDLKLWGRLFGFVGPQWRWVTLAVVLSLVITGTSLVLPRLVQLGLDRYIIDTRMEAAARMEGIARLSSIFIAMILIGFIANFFQVLVLERTGQKIMHALRQRLFSHVVHLDLSFFNSHPVGKLVTRLTNDIQNLYEMFTSVIITLFNEGIRLVGILAILFWMNWRLALILSATFPVMMVITLWFGRLSRNAFRRIRAHLAEINAFIQESVSGITVIQLFLREADLGKRFMQLNDRYRDAAFYQIHVFGIFVPLIEVMNSVAMALIIWYGGQRDSRAAHDHRNSRRVYLLYETVLPAFAGTISEVYHRAVRHDVGGTNIQSPRNPEQPPGYGNSRSSGHTSWNHRILRCPIRV